MSNAGIENDCELCENKELCPVYMGQSCLLAKEHDEVVAYVAQRNAEKT